MAIVVTTTLDDRAYRAKLAQVEAALAGADHPALRAALKQAGARYLAFIRRRFLAAARGDGTWPDLALYTKIKRLAKNRAVWQKFQRHRAKTGQTYAQAVAAFKFEILRDTGTLFNSLSTGNPGSLEEDFSGGVRVGTIIEYAHYHQDGGSIPGRPPQRKILVDPDGPTLGAIGNDLTRGVDRAIREIFGSP